MIYINIGSNIGDRLSTLELAVVMLEQAFGAKAHLTDVVESEPWGFDSPNRFVNLTLAFDTPHTPLEAFALMQQTERAIDPSSHRTATGDYADRRIDIDFIAWTDADGKILDATFPATAATGPLTLPHPHLADRPFFQTPFQLLRRRLENI